MTKANENNVTVGAVLVSKREINTCWYYDRKVTVTDIDGSKIYFKDDQANIIDWFHVLHLPNFDLVVSTTNCDDLNVFIDSLLADITQMELDFVEKKRKLEVLVEARNILERGN